MRTHTFLTALLVILALTQTTLAQQTTVDFLTNEEINASWTGNGVQFQTSYLNHTVNYSKVFKPDGMKTKKGVKVSTKEKENALKVQVDFKVSKNSSYTQLQGEKFSGKIDIKKDKTKSKFLNGSITSNTNDKIQVNASSNFEHMVISYTVSNTTDVIRKPNNIYEGELLSNKVPVQTATSTTRFENGEEVEEMKMEYDNRYDNATDVRVVTAIPEQSRIASKDFPIGYQEKTVNYTSIKNTLQTNNIDSNAILSSTDGYAVEQWNMTVPANTTRTLEVNSIAVDGTQTYMYVIGSAGALVGNTSTINKNYNNTDLTITQDRQMVGYHYNISTLNITSNVQVNVTPFNGTNKGWLEFNATKISANGATFMADGRGGGGGSGAGGQGGLDEFDCNRKSHGAGGSPTNQGGADGTSGGNGTGGTGYSDILGGQPYGNDGSNAVNTSNTTKTIRTLMGEGGGGGAGASGGGSCGSTDGVGGNGGGAGGDGGAGVTIAAQNTLDINVTIQARSGQKMCTGINGSKASQSAPSPGADGGKNDKVNCQRGFSPDSGRTGGDGGYGAGGLVTLAGNVIDAEGTTINVTGGSGDSTTGGGIKSLYKSENKKNASFGTNYASLLVSSFNKSYFNYKPGSTSSSNAHANEISYHKNLTVNITVEDKDLESVNLTKVWYYNGVKNKTIKNTSLTNGTLTSEDFTLNLSNYNDTINISYNVTDGQQVQTRNIQYDIIDTVPANITISAPSEGETVKKTENISLNFTAVDEGDGVDECSWWVTDINGNTEISNTSAPDCNSTQFTVSSDQTDYIAYVWANTTNPETNTENVSFTVDTTSGDNGGNGGGGGGGGGGSPTIISSEEGNFSIEIVDSPSRIAPATTRTFDLEVTNKAPETRTFTFVITDTPENITVEFENGEQRLEDLNISGPSVFQGNNRFVEYVVTTENNVSLGTYNATVEASSTLATETVDIPIQVRKGFVTTVINALGSFLGYNIVDIGMPRPLELWMLLFISGVTAFGMTVTRKDLNIKTS